MRPAMLAIRAAVDRYTRISREPALPGEEAVQPERFCDELLESLFADGAIEPERFFAWATRRYGWPGLLHVLAGRRAFLLGRQAEAAEHARRAIGLDQLDLYAQRLAALATPEGARQLEATEAWLKDRFCPRPFEVLETRSDGSANTCCNAWMPAAIGNIEAASAEALWNSPAAQEIRRSVLDGDYRYCSRTFCPKIAARALPRRDEVTNAGHRAILAERRTVMPHRPRRLLLSHDRSCNLSCPSCRKEPILAGKAEQERLDRLAEEVLLPLMRDARTVKVTGSGDPFGSHHFRYLLKGLGRGGAKGVKLEIQTNGQLLDARAWDDLRLEGGSTASGCRSTPHAHPPTSSSAAAARTRVCCATSTSSLASAARAASATSNSTPWSRPRTSTSWRRSSRWRASSAPTSSASSACATGALSASPSSQPWMSPHRPTRATRRCAQCSRNPVSPGPTLISVTCARRRAAGPDSRPRLIRRRNSTSGIDLLTIRC